MLNFQKKYIGLYSNQIIENYVLSLTLKTMNEEAI